MVEGLTLLFEYAYGHFYTRLAQDVDAASLYFGKGIDATYYYARNACVYNESCSRGRFAVVGTGLKAYVERAIF